MHYLYYNSTKELHSWGFPVLWAGETSNRTDPAENALQFQEEYSACHLPSTLLPLPEETIFTTSGFLSPHRTDISFSSTHFWGPLLKDSLCVQYCMSAPFLDTENLDGSHSVAFGGVTPPFGLREDLKCAVPCTTPPELRFDRTSTKLNVLFLLSVLALDTKSTTLLGAETWALPCSSELPKYAVLC